jgi:hypothetical protein
MSEVNTTTPGGLSGGGQFMSDGSAAYFGGGSGSMGGVVQMGVGGHMGIGGNMGGAVGRPHMVPVMMMPSGGSCVGPGLSHGVGFVQGRGGHSKNVETIIRTVPVPSSDTGFVIGTGGKTVKAIKSRTKTSIRHFDADPANDRPYPYFSVRGSPAGVCDAVLEIHKLMLESQRRSGSVTYDSVGGGSDSVDKSEDYTPKSPEYVSNNA